MKAFILSITLSTAFADVPVVDPALLALTERQHRESALQRGEQLRNQVKILHKLSDQLDELEKLSKQQGDPKRSRPQHTKVFDRSRVRPVIEPRFERNQISERVIVHGETTDTRDARRYTEHRKTQDALSIYQSLRADTNSRRSELHSSVLDTVDDLQKAETISEVKKLTGILLALQIELSELQHQLDRAYYDAQLQETATAAATRISAEAAREDAEHERRKNHQSVLKKFKLPRF